MPNILSTPLLLPSHAYSILCPHVSAHPGHLFIWFLVHKAHNLILSIMFTTSMQCLYKFTLQSDFTHGLPPARRCTRVFSPLLAKMVHQRIPDAINELKHCRAYPHSESALWDQLLIRHSWGITAHSVRLCPVPGACPHKGMPLHLTKYLNIWWDMRFLN